MNQIETFFSLAKKWFDFIAAATGKHKIQVIKDCKHANDGGWEALKTYLNPYIIFHIGTKSMESNIEPASEGFGNVQQMFAILAAEKGLSNALLSKVKATIASIKNDATRAFAADYIAHSIRIGITAETVNKAIGQSIIPTFGCMLANKYFDHQKDVVGKTISVTEKLDGIRALAFLSSENNITTVKVFSRQGQQIHGLTEIEEALIALSKKLEGRWVLDGELLISNRDGIPSKEQYKRTVKIVRTDSNSHKTGITYNVFDFIPYESFICGFCKSSYGNRRKALELVTEAIESTSICIVPIITTFKYDSLEAANQKIVELVTEARKSGKEGIMLNDCSAPYVCKRTSSLLKVKVFQDCDLEIIDFQEGTGKFANTLGALIVDYKGNKVGVGTGLTNEQRNEIWNNKERYIGRVATIQYFEETCDSKGALSIRFPVFVELREQGKEVSYQ